MRIIRICLEKKNKDLRDGSKGNKDGEMKNRNLKNLNNKALRVIREVINKDGFRGNSGINLTIK